MSTAANSVIESFEQLSVYDQRAVTTEILRRSLSLEYPAITDEELTAIADEQFLQLDAAEAADETS